MGDAKPNGIVRPAALAGAIFFAIVLVNSNLMSGAPTAADPAGETFEYLAEHNDRFQIAAVLWGFAMAAALVWLAGLFRVLRQAEGEAPSVAIIALAGGVLAAACTVVGALALGAAATTTAELGADAAKALWTLYLLSFGATLFGLLLLIGATAAISLRKRLFTRRFALASAVLVPVSMAGAFTIGFAGDAIQVVAGVAILLDSVWIFVVGVHLWRGEVATA
jgi:hypothetical protein